MTDISKSFKQWTKAEVFKIIENPPASIILEESAYFNKLCVINNLTYISFGDMKWALIEYLKIYYESYPCHMDVKMICKSNWKDRAFSDTAPRDYILSLLEKAHKITKNA